MFFYQSDEKCHCHLIYGAEIGRGGKLALHRAPPAKSQTGKFFDDDSFSIICMFCVLLSTNKVTFKDVVGNPTLLQLIWFLHGLKKIYLSY